MPYEREGKQAITIYPDVSLLKRMTALERLPGGILRAFKGNKNRQILYALEVGIKLLEVHHGNER